MKETINVETFNHLVELAALELDDKQAEYLRRELNHQLTAIDELAAIPLPDDIEITLHGVPYSAENSPAVRTDDWHPYENITGIMNQVPQTGDGYVVVPEIPHTDLE